MAAKVGDSDDNNDDSNERRGGVAATDCRGLGVTWSDQHMFAALSKLGGFTVT